MNLKITIRNAEMEDAKAISELLFLAMEEILYEFIQSSNSLKARELLRHFVSQKGNQYSYENCFVAELNNTIVGAINLYKGKDLETLRKPVATYIKIHFNNDFNPEDETENGEIYIDTLGVDSNMQGKGIGTRLLQFCIQKYVISEHKTLGLLVENENPKAEKLYLKLGFKFVANKTLAGKKMKHLQYFFK